MIDSNINIIIKKIIDGLIQMRSCETSFLYYHETASYVSILLCFPFGVKNRTNLKSEVFRFDECQMFRHPHSTYTSKRNH